MSERIGKVGVTLIGRVKFIICLKIGSHDPFLGSNSFPGVVSTHRNVDLRVTNFF